MLRHNKKFVVRAFILFLALGIVSIKVQSASAAPGDYDADGLSDLAVAQVNRAAQSTVWFVIPTPGKLPLGFTFPAAADALITGRFYRGDPKLYPGIVRVKDASSPLEWILKNPAASDTRLSYGTPGDSVPNQADLDCDGVTDFVVARNGRPGHFDGFKLWYVALSAKPGTVQEMLFGLASDRVGTADLDGDGCSELVVLRNDFTWYSRKLFNENVTAVQWGLPGDIALLPQDFDGDGVSDYVVARNFGNQMIAVVRQPGGNAQLVPLGTATAVPMVGNFIGTTGFAWVEQATSFVGVRQADQSNAVFRFSEPTNHIIRPDGTVIEPLISQPTTANAASSVQCDAQIRRNDGGGGFKSNPNNSRGTVKVILPKAPYTGNTRGVKAFAPDGTFIENFGSGSALEWGEREAWYGHKPLRTFPRNLLIQVQLTNGKYYCTTLENPAQVYE